MQRVGYTYEFIKTNSVLMKHLSFAMDQSEGGMKREIRSAIFKKIFV